MSKEETLPNSDFAFDLLKKLKVRNNPGYIVLSSQKNIAPHPLFKIIKGEVEDWEIL